MTSVSASPSGAPDIEEDCKMIDSLDGAGSCQESEDEDSAAEIEYRKNSKTALRQGLWTAEEDAILAACVQKFKEGNWSTIAIKSGLHRSGKSCRLRWVKHLSPTVKSGPLSDLEQRKVIDLQKTHGNKWALMAAQLPGRSDNTIKNFFNSHRKRILRRQQQLQAQPPMALLPHLGLVPTPSLGRGGGLRGGAGPGLMGGRLAQSICGRQNVDFSVALGGDAGSDDYSFDLTDQPGSLDGSAYFLPTSQSTTGESEATIGFMQDPSMDSGCSLLAPAAPFPMPGYAPPVRHVSRMNPIHPSQHPTARPSYPTQPRSMDAKPAPGGSHLRPAGTIPRHAGVHSGSHLDPLSSRRQRHLHEAKRVWDRILASPTGMCNALRECMPPSLMPPTQPRSAPHTTLADHPGPSLVHSMLGQGLAQPLAADVPPGYALYAHSLPEESCRSPLREDSDYPFEWLQSQPQSELTCAPPITPLLGGMFPSSARDIPSPDHPPQDHSPAQGSTGGTPPSLPVASATHNQRPQPPHRQLSSGKPICVQVSRPSPIFRRDICRTPESLFGRAIAFSGWSPQASGGGGGAGGTHLMPGGGLSPDSPGMAALFSSPRFDNFSWIWDRPGVSPKALTMR